MRVRPVIIATIMGIAQCYWNGATGSAEAPADAEPFEQLRATVRDQQRRIDRLESQSGAPEPAAVGGGLNLKLSVDGLFAVAGATEADLADLQIGGHDPNQRGFTVQNVELTAAAAVDPYFNAVTHLMFLIDAEGESVVELEEAYLTSTALPGNLQLKGGQFFSPFGRLNPTHPHAWEFVDQPIINGRLLGGDGLRGPGAQLAVLLPLPWYAEAIVALQNSAGETAFSFRGVPDDARFGRTLIDRPVESFDDLLTVPRLVTSVDLSDTQTILIGASAALGPNATGERTRTAIYGADLFYQWKPLTAAFGWPFFTWQTEAMTRRYEAAAAAGAPAIPQEILRDHGGYTQIVWGFRRGWTAAARFDYAAGSGGAPALEPLRERRVRVAANATFYPSEFSKWRLQYNRDDVASRDDAVHAVFLQWEFLIGEHGAHTF